MIRRIFFLAAVFAATAPLFAQFTSAPEQLRIHVSVLTSDALLGRDFGTPQGLKAAHYIADQFEKPVLSPWADNTCIPSLPGKAF